MRSIIVLACALAGCGRPGAGASVPASVPASVSASVPAAQDTCATGRFQSPIDLHAVARRGVAELTFDYRPDILRIVNNGHTVEVDHQAGSRLEFHGRSFTLAQYHIHSPSEHTVEGRRYPLEIHFVHKDAAGAMAVVGVLVEDGAEQGAEAAAIAAIWSHLPRHAGEAERVEIAVDPGDLMPAERTHFYYRGSLTTPPCTESVLWHVLDTPLRMSAAHIDAFRELYAANARAIQRPDWCPLSHNGPPP